MEEVEIHEANLVVGTLKHIYTYFSETQGYYFGELEGI
jgi:hypothetical protein